MADISLADQIVLYKVALQGGDGHATRAVCQDKSDINMSPHGNHIGLLVKKTIPPQSYHAKLLASPKSKVLGLIDLD